MTCKDPQGITRRDFAKLGAVGVAGLASVGLFGCSSKGSSPVSSSSNAAASPSSASPSSMSKSSSLPHAVNGEDAPVVFFTKSITPEGLVAVYNALGFSPKGKVAVKLSTGEPGGSNFLKPELISNLVRQLDGTIVECNTAYGGRRASTESHLKAAEDHGFTAIAPVVIMDAGGSMSLPVEKGRFLKEDLVGAAFSDYPSFVSLAHFKGHTMGGFGGAIKNCSIGIASSAGKLLIHSAGQTSTSWRSAPQNDFLDSMAEAAKAVATALSGSIAYVNVANNLSVDCDCSSNPAAPDMADIGIFASLDPVAADQACVDAVYAAPDGASVIERIESRNGCRTLEYAEQIGLGSRAYRIVDLDKA